MLAKIFGRKKLPHIISGFEKTMSHLEELQKHNNSEVDFHSELINESRARVESLNQENQRAGQIAQNIRALLQA